MVLTNTVFRVISAINKAIPKDNQLILLYSNLGFRDNVAYLYNHLIDNEYNKKYKIIRSQNDKCREIIPKNVKVVSNTKGILYFLRAGHVFYCFGKLPIYPSKHQIVIQMWHGTPFKDADEWQKATVSKQSYYTYLLIQKRIVHNHTSICDHKILNNLLKPVFNKLYTDAVACSDKAGKWLFTNNNFRVLNNGINADKFAFNGLFCISVYLGRHASFGN